MEHSSPSDIWRATWTYSFSQLDLYRLCPRRYYERYMLPPPEIALQESVSLTMIYSATVIHPGIESLHHSNSTFNLDLSIAKFRADSRVSIRTDAWDRKLADAIFASYKVNPIPDAVQFVEREGRIKIDDIITGEKNKYQFLSKPDFVTELSTWDIKLTMSTRPYPLKPFDDQMLGQAIVWERPAFNRYQVIVDPKTFELNDIVVEGFAVDSLLRENWFQRTLRTMRDIEESRRTNLWVEHDRACGAFGRVCPYMGSCVYGRVR